MFANGKGQVVQTWHMVSLLFYSVFNLDLNLYGKQSVPEMRGRIL